MKINLSPMLGYLQKFNNLPAELRRKISDPETMAKIETLEKKYKIALAALIMKVMVKEIALDDLADHFFKENLPKEPADQLAKELRQKVFSSLGDYLLAGRVKPAPPARSSIPANQPKVKGANFFFSSDDEEEIRQLAKKIEVVDNAAGPTALLDKKLKEIISRAQINFGSADLADRFSQILRTYLRGIRDRLETKATLMKPFLSGGLSFDEASAGKVMSLADKVVNPIKSPGTDADQPIRPFLKMKLPESEKVGLAEKPASPRQNDSVGLAAGGQEIARDAAYDFSRLAKKNDNSAKAGQPRPDSQESVSGVDLKPLDIGHELAPPVAAVTGDVGTMPLIKRRFEAENLSQSPKTRVEDVKYVPRVMGPLDEIKYMDLINFRRLDREPIKSVDKIKDKINLLEEEGYGKKLEAIKYWRLSPLYKLYLEIGNLSISENKPIDVIIEERKMANSNYLTDEEFKAIMDLNKSLRF